MREREQGPKKSTSVVACSFPKGRNGSRERVIQRSRGARKSGKERKREASSLSVPRRASRLGYNLYTVFPFPGICYLSFVD